MLVRIDVASHIANPEIELRTNFTLSIYKKRN